MANASFTPEEISQILEEFFRVVGTRQYIGARYVPIFGRKGEDSIAWDNTKPYEPLTIVLYQGNSFTSRQYVPADVDITNEAYWALTGNFNAQVEQYRQETMRAQEGVNAINAALPIDAFSEDLTVKDYIQSYISKNYIMCNVATGSNGATGYSMVASEDGTNFTPIPTWEYPNSSMKNDVRTLKYGDGYLLFQTISSSSADFGFAYTEDFRNVNMVNTNVGLTTYRNLTYPVMADNTNKWTPGAWVDMNGDLYVYTSMRYTTDNEQAYGQSAGAGYFKVFAVQVDFDEEMHTLTAVGNPFELEFTSGANPLVSAYDLSIWCDNQYWYCCGKNGYYRDVFYAVSANGRSYAVQKENIFGLYYTEAPNVVRLPEGEGFLIYGQVYDGTEHVNICVFTVDFSHFFPLDFPRCSGVLDTVSTSFMRNMNPWLLRRDEFAELFTDQMVFVQSEAPLLQPIYDASLGDLFEQAQAAGHMYGILDGTVMTIPCTKASITLPILNAWGNNLWIRREYNSASTTEIKTNLNVAASSYNLYNRLKIAERNIGIPALDNFVHVYIPKNAKGGDILFGSSTTVRQGNAIQNRFTVDNVSQVVALLGKFIHIRIAELPAATSANTLLTKVPYTMMYGSKICEAYASDGTGYPIKLLKANNVIEVRNIAANLPAGTTLDVFVMCTGNYVEIE